MKEAIINDSISEHHTWVPESKEPSMFGLPPNWDAYRHSKNEGVEPS